MSKKDEALKMALNALEEINTLSIGENAICLPAEIDTAMDAIREALAEQPVQQPYDTHAAPGHSFDTHSRTSPASKPWVGLTDEEVNEVLGGDIRDEPSGELEFVRAIEAKLREKNA